jgi:hypothetical protein
LEPFPLKKRFCRPDFGLVKHQNSIGQTNTNVIERQTDVEQEVCKQGATQCPSYIGSHVDQTHKA